jgi:hypothetical protein
MQRSPPQRRRSPTSLSLSSTTSPGELDGKIDYPGPNARLACALHRDELTAYAVAAGGAWQYLFTADVGRYARLDDPVVRAQYRYGFGVRIDGGTLAVERFAVRRR